jgi:DNA invertase Pin-like site-specific DNA recombinase
LHVREVNFGGPSREAREKLLDAARRREIHLVVWRLDRWGTGSDDSGWESDSSHARSLRQL